MSALNPEGQGILSSLAHVLSQLTQPADEVVEPEIRRRIRILSSLLLMVIPLGIIGVLISNLLVPASDPQAQLTTSISTVLITLVFVASYFLSRTKYYMIAAIIAVGYLVLAVLISVWFVPENTNPVLGYLSLSVLLGSILFNVRYTIILIGVCTVTGVLLPVFNPSINFSSAITIIVFNAILSALIAVLVALRQRDIEQIEHQTEQLEKAVEDARLANQLKDQFLATMSHELRTPLNAIIGFSEVMIMGLAGSLDDKSKHTTKRIHHNSQRLLNLIDDLLDISKIEAGRVDLNLEPFRPKHLLDSVERTVAAQAEENGLTLVTHVDEELPEMLVGDTARLEQILLNLATNAIKYTDEGMVKISLRARNDYTWCIEVQDTGIGISAHAQEFIFDKFRQVDGTSRRAYSGAGLGLAIVKELSLLMGGGVKVDSKVGEGSVFTVTLPVMLPAKVPTR